VTAPLDTAPVVTVANLTAAHGQSFAASSLFTASDADGDMITKYAFWDTGTGGGHFALSGVAQGTNQEIDVTAAQLSQLGYQSGSGTDTLWVCANDGSQWFVHISAVERAGLSSLNEGQVIEYEIVQNRGKQSAENLKVSR
jgi:cold shock CspA family protein